MSNRRMGTESNTIESRLVRVTTSKIAAAFQILFRSSQKRHVTTKIYGNTRKLKTHFLKVVIIKGNV